MASLRVALVTGAGSGVGRAAALALMRDGFAVVLAGRRKKPLDAVIDDGRTFGATAIAVPTDVSNPPEIKALFAVTKRTFGRLDVLFNNAGIGTPVMPLEDLPYDRWKAVLDLNLTGTFLCTQEAIRIMKDQAPRGGRIINNGSVSAHTPRPFTVAYTSSKHAITGLTKSTALDCRQYDIACGQIDIGNAATPSTDRLNEGALQPDGRMVLEARFDAAHVGRAVAYMASLPLDTNVLFMTVMATKMPLVGRG